MVLVIPVLVGLASFAYWFKKKRGFTFLQQEHESEDGKVTSSYLYLQSNFSTRKFINFLFFRAEIFRLEYVLYASSAIPPTMHVLVVQQVLFIAGT